MNRRLTSGERDLWDHVRRTVRPLARRHARAELKDVPVPINGASVASSELLKKPSAEPATSERLPTAAKKTTPPKTHPPPTPLEEKTRRRLRRGLTKIDGRIDLHGMRQDRAFAGLTTFLRHAQARGARIVLVITGKGGEGEGRGVLRNTVPAWLKRPDMRDLVAAFDAADRRHGGDGALYVQIRRRRAARRRSSG